MWPHTSRNWWWSRLCCPCAIMKMKMNYGWFINITYSLLRIRSVVCARLLLLLFTKICVAFAAFPSSYLVGPSTNDTWLDDIFKLVFRGFTMPFFFSKVQNTFLWGSSCCINKLCRHLAWQGGSTASVCTWLCVAWHWTLARYVYDG